MANPLLPETGIIRSIDPETVRLRFAQAAKLSKYVATTPVAAGRGGVRAATRGIYQAKQDVIDAKARAEASQQKMARTLHAAKQKAKSLQPLRKGGIQMQGRRSNPIPSGNAPGPLAPSSVSNIQMIHGATMRHRVQQAAQVSAKIAAPVRKAARSM